MYAIVNGEYTELMNSKHLSTS